MPTVTLPRQQHEPELYVRYQGQDLANLVAQVRFKCLQFQIRECALQRRQIWISLHESVIECLWSSPARGSTFVSFWLESCISKNQDWPTTFHTSSIFNVNKFCKMVYCRQGCPFIIVYKLGLIKDECDRKSKFPQNILVDIFHIEFHQSMGNYMIYTAQTKFKYGY